MKRLLIPLAVLVLLPAPQLTFGADVDDLKAAYGQLSKAFTSLDAAAVASMIFPGAVNFDADAAFPAVAPTENAEAQLTNTYKMLLGSLQYFYMAPYNMQFKVVGNTGIVWGHASMYTKPKDGPAQTRHVRMTSTWIKSDGKWMVLMAHGSTIPSGD